MDLTDKEFEWFLKEAKKDGIKLKTDEEYRQLQRDMYGLVDLIFDEWKFKKSLEHRLEREPEGFAFEGNGRGCHICTGGTQQMWYDKYGIRCMNCLDAYKKKILPAYVLTKEGKNRFVTDSDLEYKYKIKRRIIIKLVKDGKLKARVVEQGKYQPRYYFLLSQNKNIWDILKPYSELLS